MNTPLSHSGDDTPTQPAEGVAPGAVAFHGVHHHALTNTAFAYDGEWTENTRGEVAWRAVVRREGVVVDTPQGRIAYDPAVSDPTRAATTALHTLIDARGPGQASARPE